MSHFIVMQGRTYNEENEAGIIWTTQIDQAGNRQHSWERMREVRQGDKVFHYVNGYMVAVSSATADCVESENPIEQHNNNLNQMGYLVTLNYYELEVPLRIADHFDVIEPLLPIKYSAFQANGLGNQGYLYPCNDELTIQLLELIGEANIYVPDEEQLRLSMDSIEMNNHNPLVPLITSTESEVKTKIRVGQSKFREKLEPIWQNACPICGIRLRDTLRASRAKPWKDSTNEERLDPYNGILLCCNHDSLYNKGYISFNAKGKILISEKIEEKDYDRFLLNTDIKIPTEVEHKPYFNWHKKYIFKG